MSTRTALSEMSDPGRFEDLATAVLRRADPRYEAVVQTGINVEGKPIRDPVDGFAQVEGADPPHYIFFEYTTTQTSGLESKWLAEPDPSKSETKGDLIKAAEHAKDLRDEVPDATFTVVLVSNRRLGSDLLQRVQTKAEELGLSVDPWDVHRLSDFLDTDPEGQWLREQYFDIREKRLSRSLLMELSRQSLNAYQERFHIQTRENKPVAQRPELTTILEHARDPGSGDYLLPVVGNSGFGKTVMCYQAMEEWLNTGPALRLEPTDLQGATSLSQAIQSALDRLYPTLNSEAGSEALWIARNTDRLLLVVDDLNRASDPSRLFSRLLNWLGGAQDADEPDANGVAATVLCPLWPRIWARQERESGDSKFVEVIELGPFSSEEAAQLVRSHAELHDVDIMEPTARNLAERIGCDPHLIGLLGQLIGKDWNLDGLPDTSRDVLRQYIDYAYETASSDSDDGLVTSDYEFTVEKLSTKVLANRELEPAWRAVRKWIPSGSDDLRAVRELTAQAQLLFLLRIDERSEQLLSFRHDRIRDYLLASHTLEDIERSDSTPDYVSDPYYYSILGLGVAYFRPDDNVIACLRDHAPLALVEALQRLGDGASAGEYETTLSEHIRRWFESEQRGGRSALLSGIEAEVANLLQETDSRHVLTITDSLSSDTPYLLARFRNGDLNAGLRYCTIHSDAPTINNPRRDSVFEAATRQWGDQYAKALSDTLSEIGEEGIHATLQLAGFLGRPELGAGLEDCWEEYGDEPKLLPAFLWAAFQCCIPDRTALVDQVLSRWASLPRGNRHDDNFDDELGRGDVYMNVQHSLTRDLSEEQIQYLMQSVETFPDIDYQLLLLLKNVPDPDVIDLVVTKLGEWARESDGASFLLSRFADQWRPDHPRGQTLPPETKSRLYEIWTDASIINEVRTKAFQLWSWSTDEDDLDELRRVSDDELFARTATRQRLELDDEAVIRSPPIDFTENDYLLRSVPSAWCPEAHELVNGILDEGSPAEQDNLFYITGEVLFRIPRSDAEQLLVNHWETIGDRPVFFQAALYTATPRTKDLAEATYEASGTPAALFELIGSHFGFNQRGRSELISEEQLFSLKPYLAELDDFTLVEIAEKAKALGLTEWGKTHVRPQLSEEERPRSYPTDEELLERLDDLEGRDDPHRGFTDIRQWLDGFDKRAESTSRAFRLLYEWLTEETSTAGYRLVAHAAKTRGTRDDLTILQGVPLDEEREFYYDDAEFGVEVRTLN